MYVRVYVRTLVLVLVEWNSELEQVLLLGSITVSLALRF